MDLSYTIALTDNVLGPVLAEVRQTAQQTLTDAGDLFRETAQNEAPISWESGKDYIHMVETINYDVDTDTMPHQFNLLMFVIPEYSQYVNFGTSRMPPQPFFTYGVLAVQSGYSGIVLQAFAPLLSGHWQGAGAKGAATPW